MKYCQNGIQRIFLALLVFTVLGAGASAEETQRPKTENPKRTEVRQKVAEFKMREGKTCEKLASRIDARLADFGGKYERHKAIYQSHREKLLTISAKLEAEGVATAKLEANIALLDGKIAKFEADHQKVKAALEAAKGKSCAESKEEFKASVKAVRDAQKEIAEDARDIFEFIKGTLRQDIITHKANYHADGIK